MSACLSQSPTMALIDTKDGLDSGYRDTCFVLAMRQASPFVTYTDQRS